MEPQSHPMSFICPALSRGIISLCIMVWKSWGSNSFVSNGNEGQLFEHDKIKISEEYVAACSLDWKNGDLDCAKNDQWWGKENS